MLTVLRRSALALSGILIVLQIVPSPTRPLTQQKPSREMLLRNVSSHEVAAVLTRACKDCHSNQTAIPWYGHVAPISWMLAKDVHDGRKKLDFTDWDSRQHSPNEMEEICDAVSNGSMPLRAYTLIHRGAKLSTREVEAICNWADSSSRQNFSSQAR